MTARVVVNGCQGRMGQALLALIESDSSFELVAAMDRDNPWPAPSAVDAVIDFSSSAGQQNAIRFCERHGISLVSGTTGADNTPLLEALARESAVVFDTNFSYGIALLKALAQSAAQSLGSSFEIEIVEAHHKHKRDAPSGTALSLAEAIVSKRPELKMKHGREGKNALRQSGEIGMHALRGGSVVGEHSVAFYSDEERLVLSHRAERRSVFAAGALRAAKWSLSQSPGLYDMSDVISAHIPKAAPI